MNLRPLTILIVSPDRLLLRRLSKFLEVFGYGVLQATDNETALVAAKSARPDFLILDQSGGRAGDMQLCGAIRRIWQPDYIYTLLLAGGLEVADVTTAIEAGCDDFLAAPIVFGELLARLRAGARFMEYERRLLKQSGVDSHTGLADQSALTAELHRRSQSAKGRIGWLALLELDYFERIANASGRAGTAEAIAEVGRRLALQASEGYFAAALSESRFAVLQPPSGGEMATAWCEELVLKIAESTTAAGGEQHRLTMSCGIAEVMAGEAPEALLSRCQRALALAKASGHGQVITSDDVDRDADEWAAFAADGKLFETTLARDVMHHCPLLLHLDETLEQAHALLSQAGLAYAPVIDAEGKLAGLISLDQLAAARLRHGKPRHQETNSSSIRLVRHLMNKEVTRFDEETPLAELMDFFTGENATLAIIVGNNEPRGLVHCHALAALNERLTDGHFAAAQPLTGKSADLMVPDLALAE